jgi:hypothetical protein
VATERRRGRAVPANRAGSRRATNAALLRQVERAGPTSTRLRDKELRPVILVVAWACDRDLQVDARRSGKERMTTQRSNTKTRAGRSAGSSPTYPPPPPRGLSPVLERNIRALQLRRESEEKEATSRSGSRRRLPASPAACGSFTCTSPYSALGRRQSPLGFPASPPGIRHLSSSRWSPLWRPFSSRLSC